MGDIFLLERRGHFPFGITAPNGFSPEIIAQMYQTEMDTLLLTGNYIGAVHREEPNKNGVKKNQFLIAQKFSAGKELFELILFSTGQPFDGARLLLISLQLLEQVAKFHGTFRYFHCDIKPENSMYDLIKLVLNLIDTATAIEVTRIDQKVFIRGTYGFMAPENVGQREHQINESTEIHALGGALLDLFQIRNLEKKFAAVPVNTNESIKRLQPIFGRASADIVKMIERIVAQDPRQRPPIQELLVFFKRQLEIHLQRNPLQRYRSILFFDINEYQNLGSEAHKRAYLNAFKNDFSWGSNVVFLIDSSGQTMNKARVYALYLELEKAGLVSISRDFFRSDSPMPLGDMLTQIPAIIEREKLTGNLPYFINAYYCPSMIAITEAQKVQLENDQVKHIPISYSNPRITQRAYREYLEFLHAKSIRESAPQSAPMPAQNQPSDQGHPALAHYF